MGKKKRTQLFVLKPWCWYCEREFEDEKVLLQHQKSKHFKCQLCPRKLNTAGGLMVHSQQVHKCEPEPLTNTLPGRDGYDIEIFGMEGVPTNALAEWKARKESEAGTAALAAAAAAQRPIHSYTVIPEADLVAALAQHKILMAARHTVPQSPGPAAALVEAVVPPPFSSFPPGYPPMPMAGFQPPPFMPPFPPPSFPPTDTTPLPAMGTPVPSTAPTVRPPPAFVPAVDVQPPKDGVMWPDTTASPAEKRAQQPRYRYTSPSPESMAETGMKRKAAADFL